MSSVRPIPQKKNFYGEILLWWNWSLNKDFDLCLHKLNKYILLKISYGFNEKYLRTGIMWKIIES